MIEDALTTTRALHRFLLAASAVALVFVFSLADVRSDRQLLENVRRLQSLPVKDYNELIDEEVRGRITPSLVSPALQFQQELERQLTAAGLQVFSTGRLADHFRSPLHTGRLNPEQLVLVQPNATLEQLDRVLSDLPIDRKVQVVTADPAGLIPKIVAFISENTVPGLLGLATARIENVQVQVLDASYESTDSFLPPDASTPLVLLTFELHRDGIVAAPIFEERFPAKVQSLPNSSFREWLIQRDEARNLFGEVGGQLRWLSSQVPSGPLRKKPLNALEEELAKRIDSATAKNRTIDLPGISVPGSLALFAIPILLLSFASSLLHHLEHLQRLASSHRETFSQFAWTPLTAGSWRWEMASTSIFLPVLAQAFLAWRHDAFELPASLVITIGLTGALGSLLLGRKNIQRLGDLRRTISVSKVKIPVIGPSKGE